MYEKGLLKVVTPPCGEAVQDGYCDYYGDDDHVRFVHDTRASDSPAMRAGTIYLPHSCKEWVIGGLDQVRLMIEDLQAILTQSKGIV